jgi:hypothetical protein
MSDIKNEENCDDLNDSFDENKSRGGEYIEKRSSEQIRSDDQLYTDFVILRQKYLNGANPGMTVFDLFYIEAILCPEIAWKTHQNDPFVSTLVDLKRNQFFAYIREINQQCHDQQTTQPYKDHPFEYFVDCCEKKTVDEQVLKPFMDKYLAYLKKHLEEINPSFFPQTIPECLEFWIRIIPGYCKDVLGFDEQQFLSRISDEQWIDDIGMQNPPPVTYTLEQEQYRSFVRECFRDKQAFWKYMEEFGVSEEYCFGISHTSGFSSREESTRGTLLPRNKMDEDSHHHEVMEMKNIPTEYLDKLRVKVQEKYPYLWVENAPE